MDVCGGRRVDICGGTVVVSVLEAEGQQGRTRELSVKKDQYYLYRCCNTGIPFLFLLTCTIVCGGACISFPLVSLIKKFHLWLSSCVYSGLRLQFVIAVHPLLSIISEFYRLLSY